MRVLDLFSGIGGFSLGLERAGMQTVAFCEIEPYCRAVLRKHWPSVPIFEDVRTLHAEDVGAVDLICGGFPCQDISVAGKGAGLAGARSGLWSEFRRLIEEIRPQWVVIENVSALRSRGLDQVLREISALGYDAEWHCIPASAVGADHQRDRIWIIAYPNEVGGIKADERWWQSCQAEVGEIIANDYGARLQGWGKTGKNGEDARNLGPRLGFALDAATPFPELDGAGAPVLGRGEDGIPNRVDRMHALGNTVVPQIPEIIGKAIMNSHHGLPLCL